MSSLARRRFTCAVFDQFTSDNNPHREHDYGSFEIVNRKFFWKIDDDERCESPRKMPPRPGQNDTRAHVDARVPVLKMSGYCGKRHA